MELSCSSVESKDLVDSKDLITSKDLIISTNLVISKDDVQATELAGPITITLQSINIVITTSSAQSWWSHTDQFISSNQKLFISTKLYFNLAQILLLAIKLLQFKLNFLISNQFVEFFKSEIFQTIFLPMLQI